MILERKLQGVFRAVSQSDLIKWLGWIDVMRLRCVSLSMIEALDDGHRGFQILSNIIANEIGKNKQIRS
jgi:hypothetical protein